MWQFSPTHLWLFLGEPMIDKLLIWRQCTFLFHIGAICRARDFVTYCISKQWRLWRDMRRLTRVFAAHMHNVWMKTQIKKTSTCSFAGYINRDVYYNHLCRSRYICNKYKILVCCMAHLSSYIFLNSRIIIPIQDQAYIF